MQPQRIQLRRQRGWRIPTNTVKVDRSTRWGNPFRQGQSEAHPQTGELILVDSKDMAIALFELYLKTKKGVAIVAAAQVELRGKNLACWCKDGEECHADVLLKIANVPLARAA